MYRTNFKRMFWNMNEVSPKYSLCGFCCLLSTTKVGRSTHKGRKVVQADNPIIKCRFQLSKILCVCRWINDRPFSSSMLMIRIVWFSSFSTFWITSIIFDIRGGTHGDYWHWNLLATLIFTYHIIRIICGNYDIIYKGHDVQHISINTQTSIDHYQTISWVSKRWDYKIFREQLQI